MIPVHIGTYKFLKKRDGYTVDYCDTCKDYTQCDSIRYLSVLHWMWIPILPLGISRDWICHTCKKPPRTVHSVREIAGWTVGLLSSGVMSLAFLYCWVLIQMKKGIALGGDIEFLIGALIAGLVSLYTLFRLRKVLIYRKTIRERRKPAQRYTIESCLECGCVLNPNPRPHCPECGLKVY